MVGRGQVSIAGATDIARCALDDGLLQEAVAAFGSLGNNGISPANSERDLTRWLKHLFGFDLETYSVTFQLQVSCPNLWLRVLFKCWWF